MSLWRHINRGLRVLTNRTGADRDVADEVEHYLEQSVAASIEAGLSPEEARRAARVELGNNTAIREKVREYGWENAVETLFCDFRYALRRLSGSPGYTATSMLTLALGIGASTAIFSVIEGVLLKPLPYPHSEQLVHLRHTAPGIRIEELEMAPSLYFTYGDENRVFQDIAMWTSEKETVTGLAEPEIVPALAVTHRFLPILGARPALGRGFTAEDDDPRNEQTVLLSSDYWQSRFGGDLSVLGRRLLIDGSAREVIGVLPASFRFMDRKVSMLLPLRLNRAKEQLVNFCCRGVARLKPDVTLAQANADIARMLPMAPAKFPVNPGFSAAAFADARIGPHLQFLKDALVGDMGNTLWVLMGTVGIVLLIACANVANLLLVRADGRRHELAIRAALGGSRKRIARELLLESILLGLGGGALGLALAYCALRMLAASGQELPRMEDISIDWRVVTFTFGISLFTGTVFGLIPVFKYAQPHLSNALRSGGRSISQSKERHRASSLLVVAQVALALVLMVGSGLMLRTFHALHNVDPGFSGAYEVETLHIYIPEKQVKQPERVLRMEDDILKKLGSTAGVAAVAMIDELPLEKGSSNPIFTEDRPSREGAVPPVRRFKFVSPGYVSAIGSRLIAGRDLTWTETYNQTPVAMVSENLARELWRHPQAAVGKRIRTLFKGDWREVIGVVADLRDDGIDREAPAIVYWPLMQKNFWFAGSDAVRSVAYVIRTPRAGSTGLLQELQRAVGSVNPNLPLADVKTLESVYDRSLARTSFTLVLLAIAGAMALLLGVIGLYGVISYSVSQRSREIGIRLALGAPVESVTGMFVRHGLAMSCMGTVCGLMAAFGLTRLMKSVLFDVSPADPLTFAGAVAALIVAAAAGSYLPARRAARVDPLETLRAE